MKKFAALGGERGALRDLKGLGDRGGAVHTAVSPRRQGVYDAVLQRNAKGRRGRAGIVRRRAESI